MLVVDCKGLCIRDDNPVQWLRMSLLTAIPEPRIILVC
jgi:hypothetical protein